jgi:iron-sulfur cluster assembly accessory protein|tara:strand:- start:1654 stop:2019 length:366 start_codon:yes stop_codon:yes gene_type:complete
MEIKTFNPVEDLITLTPSAQKHFKEVSGDSEALGIRLKLTGGGCAGYAYDWELVKDLGDVKLTEWSKQFEGFEFFLDDMSRPYLQGSIVDKISGIAGNMIDITSPLASSKCGCGESVTFEI